MGTEEHERAENARKKLEEILLLKLPAEGSLATAIPGLHIARHDHAGVIEHRFERPIVSLLVQGRKKTLIGSSEFILTPNQLLTVALDMPSSSLIMDASPDLPLLALYFYIDQHMIGELTLEIGEPPVQAPHAAGISVAEASLDMLECITRLISLTRTPEQISVRSKIIMAELHYLLMIGPQKDVLRAMYGSGAYGDRIFRVVEYLKSHLSVPVRSEELTRAANMSESSLHRHFKILTGLSPLQYHKQLRLHEARRLMLAENEQATLVARRVGYESVTQFNREYKRLFGQPPRRSRSRP